jgi:uncharacterized oligopeptide transporter (OPT) family protein
VVIGAALLLVFSVQARTSPPAVSGRWWLRAVRHGVDCRSGHCQQQSGDHKAGQLVDATPWKQQVALVIGVFAGAAIIPPILTCSIVLRLRRRARHAPRAPASCAQAGLISALARGVIQNNVDWSLIKRG